MERTWTREDNYDGKDKIINLEETEKNIDEALSEDLHLKFCNSSSHTTSFSPLACDKY